MLKMGPELDRKDILARQRIDAVEVGGEVKQHHWPSEQGTRWRLIATMWGPRSGIHQNTT